MGQICYLSLSHTLEGEGGVCGKVAHRAERRLGTINPLTKCFICSCAIYTNRDLRNENAKDGDRKRLILSLNQLVNQEPFCAVASTMMLILLCQPYIVHFVLDYTHT